MRLPEFGNGKCMRGINARLFNAPCNYDLILGRDFLRMAGIDLFFTKQTIRWLDRTIEMRAPDHFNDPGNVADALWLADDEVLTDGGFLELHLPSVESAEAFLAGPKSGGANITQILDAKYQEVTPEQVAAQQDHMNNTQRQAFKEVLAKYQVVFDGKLGRYPHEKIHIDLIDGARPVWKKPYPVPYRHREVFKKECQHLVNEGVIAPTLNSEWGFPAFIIPKKDGRVRWLVDLRELNKLVKRPKFSLPRIPDIMNRRRGYDYFTKIDLSMMFYCFELDEESQKICTLTTEHGNYRCLRLPMGLKSSPDYAQAFITKILNGLDVEVYIDDMGLWTSGSFEEHMLLVDSILQRLAANGMKCNPLKCEWAVKESDFLGYWLTPEGVKPWQKKVDGILKMGTPQNQEQVRSFLGAVNYYKSMWPRRSHLLAPLTALTGSGPYVWTPACDKAFKEMKALLAHDAINIFPDLNLPFDIYTDASDYQLGAAILQTQPPSGARRPIAYWSKKLDKAQLNYSTMEKELLAVILCLKEYRNMLYGGQINIYTDHKNLTFRTLSQARVLRWRLAIEDFDITWRYIPGKDNVLADCFSRVPRMSPCTVGDKEKKMYEQKRGVVVNFKELTAPVDDADVFYLEQELHECLLNLPPVTEMDNPLTWESIHAFQLNDPQCHILHAMHPADYIKRTLGSFDILTTRVRKPRNRDPDTGAVQPNEYHWVIYLPAGLVQRTLRWYHLLLGHCGATRLYDTISARFFHPRLSVLCKEYQCPDKCHRFKQLGQGYGHLPPKEAILMPWDEVCVDLIGPWKILIGDTEVNFKALTCIDPVTNLLEVIRINNKSSAHVAEQFANCWLSRYPRPNRCIHDNGTEFLGHEFLDLLNQYGVKSVPTTVKNPQANAVCERVHQTIANVLRATLHTRTDVGNEEFNEEQLIDNALASAMHATRCAVSASLHTSPGAMVFHRDMIMDIPLIADLATIRNRRQHLVNENLRRENSRRIKFKYQVGQQAYMKTYEPDKLSERLHGPYPIVEINTNGTVVIQRSDNVRETVNIRKLVPDKESMNAPPEELGELTAEQQEMIVTL